MKFDDLHLFTLAARHGSLTAAGKEIGLSPAAASARLTALERDLGTSLMARTTRSLSLTADGAAFLTHAEKALAELENGRAGLSSASATPRGLLRATVPGPFGRKHILPFLPEFRDKYPEVELDLHLSDELVNLIEDGYDLGIRIGVPADSTLTRSYLAPNRRVVVASPAFIEKHGAPTKPEECAAFDVVYQPNLRNWRFSKGDQTAAVRVSGPIRSSSGAAIHDAALLGLGIALKSIWDVGPDLKSGRLVQLLTDWTFDSDGEIYAVRPPAGFTSPKARALIDLLKAKYGPKPYWEV